jgi:hypothetical protein
VFVLIASVGLKRDAFRYLNRPVLCSSSGLFSFLLSSVTSQIPTTTPLQFSSLLRPNSQFKSTYSTESPPKV